MTADLLAFYHRQRKKALVFSVCLLIALTLLLLFGVNTGAMFISVGDGARIILSQITGNARWLGDIQENAVAVIWQIRLPRILCGMLVGMALSMSGVIFQSILQNPMADPYTMGVSTGAAFGASLALFFNMTFGLLLPVTPTSLFFALVTLRVVIYLSGKGGGLVTGNMIISGMIVSAIFSSGISFLKIMAGENVSAIVFWLMGSLSAKSWDDVVLLAPVILVCAVVAVWFADRLNIMSLGERQALSLGVNVHRTRLLYLLLGAFMTAVCVSVCGIIGFVGLIVPHMLRFWLSADNRLLMPISGLSGALLLGLADNFARLLGRGDMPVGVLTTLLGGPFFIYLFIKRQGGARLD
ncbi:FecCD family ABC transporter permease [Oscillospiraceae bacterium LTW-04]|nr:iron ABC transporter permease [Oscillospiraceae bacterium MB24-C1]